jgi:hypothetical protein
MKTIFRFFLALILCALTLWTLAGCSGACHNGLRMEGILVKTGNCSMECSGGKPCKCGHECPCWRTH